MDYKEIQGYPNYLIYRDGRVWSKNRKRFLTFKIDTHKSGKQYCRIRVNKNDKQKGFLIHRLLAIAFIPNPLNLPEVDHIDRNSLNNDLSNLRWVTRSQNQQNKICKNNLGKYIYKTKYNTYQVQIRIDNCDNFGKTYKTLEEAILNRNSFLEYMGEDYLNIDT
mgnify:CR=1 FL=1